MKSKSGRLMVIGAVNAVSGIEGFQSEHEDTNFEIFDLNVHFTVNGKFREYKRNIPSSLSNYMSAVQITSKYQEALRSVCLMLANIHI